MIEFQTGDAFAVGQDGGLSELAQLAAVDKSLQDVLLDVEISVGDGGEPFTQVRQVLNSFLDAVIGDIVGR